jgi:hypothetical protein
MLVPTVLSHPAAWATAAVLDTVRDCEVQGAPIGAGLAARNDFFAGDSLSQHCGVPQHSDKALRNTFPIRHGLDLRQTAPSKLQQFVL